MLELLKLIKTVEPLSIICKVIEKIHKFDLCSLVKAKKTHPLKRSKFFPNTAIVKIYPF
jgi:hypothetical protein